MSFFIGAWIQFMLDIGGVTRLLRVILCSCLFARLEHGDTSAIPRSFVPLMLSSCRLYARNGKVINFNI